MKSILCLLFAFAFSPAHANSWVSSGSGDLYRSDKNPWFIRNTKTVNFCIQLDQKGISVSRDVVGKHVRTAIDYWKRELHIVNTIKPLQQPRPSVGGAEIGTQEFVEVACDNKEDLRFIIGAGALTLKQRLHLQNVRRHLGATVRTEYDYEQLRGRGFVFIGSDQGMERFIGLPFETQKLWTMKNMMPAMLAHELGHVFGLPHFGGTLMSEAFAEKISNPLSRSMLMLYDRLPPVLRAPSTSDSCLIDRDALNALGYEDKALPQKGATDVCLRIALVLSNDKESFDWLISAFKKDKPEQTTPLGRLVMPRDTAPEEIKFPFDFNLTATTMVYLDDTQKVFRPEELLRIPDPKDPTKTIAMDYLYGTGEVKYGMNGRIELLGGTKKSAYIHFGAAGYKIHTDVKGETRLVFNSDQLWFF